ncbi:hypothetical protein [Comamonas aquatica]|uniref:hypothetical protein n=1 Tax=Comamonas aquatica TaxID=225991 RepID=UPI0024499C30|nr:hypothetical protein [Comamonas aquatica]MDH1815394.1 hypothetical protein [Comamonas aquatica]
MTHTVTLKPKRYWKQNAALLAKQAETMSNDKLAAAHNATPKQIRNQLHKLGIKSRAADNATAARKAHLQVLAAKLTANQLADREGKTVSAIRQELTRLGLKAVQVKRNVWADRRPQLEEYAKTHTAQQLADKYRCDVAHMYRLLNRFGITAQPAKPGPARRTPQPCSPRNPRPSGAPAKAGMGTTPTRTSIASTTPAQIVWPPHVQVQRIPLPDLPGNHRICNGSSRAPYQPGKVC